MTYSASTLQRNPGLTQPGRKYENPDGTWQDGHEDAFQAAAEAWLEEVGFWRSTQPNHMRSNPPRGWFGHIPRDRTKGMFILLDLAIWHPGGRFMQIELKTENGRLNPHQRQMILHDPHCHCARTLEAVRWAVGVEGFLCDVVSRNWARERAELVAEIQDLYCTYMADPAVPDGVTYDLRTILIEAGRDAWTEELQAVEEGK